MNKNRITLRAFIIGALFAAIFAAMSVYISLGASTQIPELPYLLLIIMVLLINPLCRLIRIVRAFSVVEIVVIFTMGMISAGISTIGLTSQLVPIAGSLFNSAWNTRYSEWNRYIVPYLNEQYFLAEPGIQAAASEYKDALKSLLEKKDIYKTVLRVSDQARLIAIMEADLARISRTNSVKTSELKTVLENARLLQTTALREWQVLHARYPHLPEWKEVLRLLPPEIDDEERIVEEAEEKLAILEEPAFQKVAVFRRGLPKDERAVPGILPLAGDDFNTYFGRLHRLIGGMDALAQMKQTLKSVGALPAQKIIDRELAASYGEHLARAVKVLALLNKHSALERLQEDFRRQDDEFAAKRVELAAQLRTISEEKRKADRRRVLELNNQYEEIIGAMKRLETQYKNYKDKLESFHNELSCAEKIQQLTGGINTLQKQLSSGGMRAGALTAGISALMPLFPSIDISLRRYFIGQIPWNCWIKPLSRWALLIGLTYIVLMALNVLIFRQWAHNERLIYPLAELPKALIGGTGDDKGLPSVLYSGFFWAGAAISGSVLGWNIFCSTGIMPGLTPLDLKNPWLEHVDQTQFAAWSYVRTEVFFTVIGLSFLVPKNISFSLWFFYVVYMVQLFIMVTAGYGQDARSFPSDWWYTSNFRNAQGQGALLIFSGFILYKCRKYILCAFFPASVADLEADERNELRLSSIAFLGCSLGLILMLWLSMGANLFYTIFFYVIILVVTIGLVRAVAEGGLLCFQSWASPMHYLRNFFGLGHTWTSPALFAPLMVFYSIIFLDIKAFIAPAMANALKLREDFRVRRFSFHIAMALAIIVAVVVAVATALMMCYHGGADTMRDWFYNALPRRSVFGRMVATIKDASSASASNINWTLGGGLTMAALLFFRQFYFGLPHPIGLVMLVNPLMDSYWFSIFLGWLCNLAVSKYGNKDTFQRAKGLFIGLIVGELIMVVVSFVLTITTGIESGVNLNRN